jgi:hypothetical protein
MNLKKDIMQRDGLTSEEADEMINDARERVMEGENPDEILHEDFGLEPDYIFDLI